MDYKVVTKPVPILEGQGCVDAVAANVGVVLIAQVVGIVDGVSGEPTGLVVAVGAGSIGAVYGRPYVTGLGNCELAVPVLITAGNTKGTSASIHQVSHVTAVTGLVVPSGQSPLLGVIVVVVCDLGIHVLHEVEHSLISGAGVPCSPRDSQESSPTPQFKSINSSALSLLHSPTLTSIHDHKKNHSLD